MSTLDNLGDLLDHNADSAKTAVIDLAAAAAPRSWSHGEVAPHSEPGGSR